MNCLGSSCIFLPKEPKYRLYDRWVRSKSPQCFALINISFGTKFFGYRELAGVATMIKYSARAEIWLRATLEGASESAQSLPRRSSTQGVLHVGWIGPVRRDGEQRAQSESQECAYIDLYGEPRGERTTHSLTHRDESTAQTQPPTDWLFVCSFRMLGGMSVLPPRLLLTNTSENTTNNTPPLS